MFIVHGIYKFKAKPIGFRNDYCLTCGRERRSERIRTFNVWHIFWIPLIPLGFWKQWVCPACQSDPHVYPGTRRSFKWAGLIALVIFTGIFWLMPPDPDFSAPWLWLVRIGSSVGVLLLLRHLLKSPPDVRIRDKLKLISPATDTACPFCGMQLMVAEPCYCPGCGAVRY